MGGVEDGQPPSKRLRLSFAGSSSPPSGSRAEEPVAAGSLRDLMARHIKCQGEEEVIGSRGVIKRLEFVRLIASALYALGYKRSGACLEEESGIPLHSAAVNLLMQHVLDGRWDESASLLEEIGLEDETIIKSAKFLILEQKFFELLDDGKTMDALKTLRTEISPLHIKTSRVHELSSCLLYHPQNQNGFSRKSLQRSEVLDELQKLFPPTIMLPARRLEYLVEQALTLQRGSCIFHNSSDWEMSLYADHQCGRDNIPSHTSQILEGHQDEVWFLQFSHKGKYLASASIDRSAIIWEVGVNGEVALKHRLQGHEKPVSRVSWSPDDQQLLTCGTEETVRRWDVLSGECLQVYGKAGIPVVSCAWSPGGESIFAGFADKSICMWDLNGKELECWEGPPRTLKISDLEITHDGKQIISICKETAILLLDRETKAEKFIEEDQAITSFSLSNDSKFLLVNLLNQEIHLWTIDGDVKLLAKYKGHKRSRFIIRSCFGGLEQSFIASGSEDSQVYIWHRGSGQLVDILPGHSGVVNCVSWSPDPHMLASASDDRTIRIWGLHGSNVKRRVSLTNGTNHCSGKF